MAFIIKLAMTIRAVSVLVWAVILIVAFVIALAINISTREKDDKGGKGHGNR